MKKTAKRLLCLLLTLCVCIPLSSAFFVTAEALTPYKTVSASYKASEFHTKLTAIELTGNERYDVVNIALSQVGYHASDSADDLGGSCFTGTGQYTQFGKDYGMNAAAWCVIFVSWCMRQARVPTSVGPNQASCSKYISWLKSNATYIEAGTGYVPVTGDLIFFCDLWENKSRYPATHVGFVVGMDKNYVYTVEGNANLSVLERKYAIDNPYIVGYGIPKYNDTKAVDYAFPLESTTSATGEYIIPEGGIPVYAGPGRTYEQTGTLPAGSVFTGFASLGFGRVYFNEDGTVSNAVVDTKVKTHLAYAETPTAVSGWFCLEDAEWVNPEAEEKAVSFDTLGGSFASEVKPIPMTKDEPVEIPADVPEKPHNKFLGWGVTKLDTVPRFMPGDKYTGRDSLCLYAIWDPEMLTASFYDEDGKTLLARNSYAYDSAVKFTMVPTKPADKNYTYEFSGWSPKLTDHITSDQQYIAVFKAVPIPPETTKVITTVPITTKEITTEPITTQPVTTEPVTTPEITTEEITVPETTVSPVPTTGEVTTEPAATSEPVIISSDIVTSSPDESGSPENTGIPGSSDDVHTDAPRTDAPSRERGDDIEKYKAAAIAVIGALLILVIIFGIALIRKK